MNKSIKKVGKLTLIIGPMYAGKTTKLLEYINKCNNTDRIVFKHKSDTRYQNNLVITHDNKHTNCFPILKCSEIFDSKLLNERQNIFIDEGQFFDDLYESVNKLLKLKKKIYISGLDGDYRQEPFGNGDVLKLIPKCDELIKLYSKCFYSGEIAPFTKRITNDKEQVIVGSVDVYKPVSRYYLENNS